MIPCLLFLITNPLASVTPSSLTRQWPCPAPLLEPTAEAGYPRTGQTPITASPSLSASAKHPGRRPAWADSRSPPGWCAATAPAWCPSSHSPELAALSSHTCPRQHGAALARYKPERCKWGGQSMRATSLATWGGGGAGWGQLAREARTSGEPTVGRLLESYPFVGQAGKPIRLQGFEDLVE